MWNYFSGKFEEINEHYRFNASVKKDNEKSKVENKIKAVIKEIIAGTNDKEQFIRIGEVTRLYIQNYIEDKHGNKRVVHSTDETKLIFDGDQISFSFVITDLHKYLDIEEDKNLYKREFERFPIVGAFTYYLFRVFNGLDHSEEDSQVEGIKVVLSTSDTDEKPKEIDEKLLRKFIKQTQKKSEKLEEEDIQRKKKQLIALKNLLKEYK